MKAQYRFAREFLSKSNPDKTYLTMVQLDGKLTCDCPAWRFKKAGRPRTCKHTDTLAASNRTEIRGDFVYLAEGVRSSQPPVTVAVKRTVQQIAEVAVKRDELYLVTTVRKITLAD